MSLGSGSNEAWVYNKDATQPVVPLETSTNLRWGRVMNDISTADVSLTIPSNEEHSSILGQIGTWGHSVVMFRDGKRCWEGPITNLIWKRGGMAIQAKDVLGWSMRKATHIARLVASSAPATDEMYYDITQVFSSHDPNVLAHVQRIGAGTGPPATRDVKLFGGYYSDQLTELAKGGACFTVVGRKIVLWPVTSTIGRTATLLPEEHMSGEVEIEEDGMGLSTHAVAVNDESLYGLAAGNAIHSFYGQLEEVVPYDCVDAPTLAAVAEQWREAHFPAPLSLNVSQGSVLSPEAPFEIEELVAGTLVPVKVERGVRLLEATQQLMSMEVTDGPEGEKVAVTVAPVSGVVT